MDCKHCGSVYTLSLNWTCHLSVRKTERLFGEPPTFKLTLKVGYDTTTQKMFVYAHLSHF